MSLRFTTTNTTETLLLLFHVLFIYLLIVLCCKVEAEKITNVTIAGAIINVNSRIGKEQRTAMEVAAENFNKHSKAHQIILHFRDTGRDPFLAASAADELIKEKKVEVIVGMEAWQEVADLGSQAKLPIFQQGSPIARDFTKAILELLEDGELKSLENIWLAPKRECLDNATSGRPESLKLENFSGLYVISGSTSTICLLLALTILLRKLIRPHPEGEQGNASPSDEGHWKKTVTRARLFYSPVRNIPIKAPTSADVEEESSSSRRENTITATSQEHLQVSMPAEIEGCGQELIERRRVVQSNLVTESQ